MALYEINRVSCIGWGYTESLLNALRCPWLSLKNVVPGEQMLR